jgi:DNA-binding transcriptional MerR regulator
MQLFKAKQHAQKEVDKALVEVGMTIEEVRKYLDKHPSMMSPFHRSPHMAGCTAADLIYEVGARKNRLSFLKNKVVSMVRGTKEKSHEEAHIKLLQIARNAAAKTRKKNSIVTVAPEVDPEDVAAPPIPAGRKSLRVVN